LINKSARRKGLICAAILASMVTPAQGGPAGTPMAELRVHIVSSQPGKYRPLPAVVWLEPQGETPSLPFPPRGHYTLLQKNRTFIPHLQVIPVGSVVQFPNADPFFHNVFSLFDGKRFDLGLYEAGSSKSVTFPTEGISYIFCNIHPEMSAVVLSLSTPLYAVGENDSFVLRNLPSGDYKLHIWVEGVPQSTLETLARPVHLSSHTLDLGDLRVPFPRNGALAHANKFGHSYDTDPKSTY
jgi:plastocyanin